MHQDSIDAWRTLLPGFRARHRLSALPARLAEKKEAGCASGHTMAAWLGRDRLYAAALSSR